MSDLLTYNTNFGVTLTQYPLSPPCPWTRTQFPTLNLCSLTWSCLLLQSIFNSLSKSSIHSLIASYINAWQCSTIILAFFEIISNLSNFSPSKTAKYFSLIPSELILHQQSIQKSRPRSTAIHPHRAWHLQSRNRSLEEELENDEDNGPKWPSRSVPHAADEETLSLDDSAQHSSGGRKIVNNRTSNFYLALNAFKCVLS